MANKWKKRAKKYKKQLAALDARVDIMRDTSDIRGDHRITYTFERLRGKDRLGKKVEPAEPSKPSPE